MRPLQFAAGRCEQPGPVFITRPSARRTKAKGVGGGMETGWDDRWRIIAFGKSAFGGWPHGPRARLSPA